MIGRELKILIKTFADATGLTKLGAHLKAHSVVVKGFVGIYKMVESAGKTAFRAIAEEMRMLRNAAIATGVALAGTIRDGYKFNTTLAQTVNMFSGSKIGNFVKFRKEIIDLSSTLGMSAESITKALYQAGSAQMSPEQSFEAIRKAAQGAIADGAEMTDVLSGIIAGVKSFGGDVGQTAEQLYRIVQLGQTTFGEVGQYLNQVAPVAAANEVSLGEVGGAIAQLTSKTIPLSQTVNMLRNMMSKLNEELGDGWHKTRSFQDAIEEVAKKANYSQNAMAKAFGLENLAGVNALIGKNFADSKRQLGEFKGELKGLGEGAQFADSLRGWAKILQSIRGFVTDIGSEIERKWAPALQYIAEKINNLRKGEGFQRMVDSISTKLKTTVADLLAHVKTISDLFEKIKGADFSGAKFAEVGKTVVTEIVSFAVSLLAELLMAHIDVFIALAKVFAGAFKKEINEFILKHGTGAQKAGVELKAQGVFSSMKYADREALARQYGFKSQDELGAAIVNAEGRSGNESIIAEIASMGGRKGLDTALKYLPEKVKEAVSKVGEEYKKSTAEIRGSITSASGENYEVQYAHNRAQMGRLMFASQDAEQASAQPDNKAQVLAFLQQRKALEEADLARKTTQYGGSQNAGVLTVLAREREDVERVNKMIGEVVGGNAKLMEEILVQLKRMNAEQKTMHSQMRSLPL